ncbi:hypothetical protein SI65_09340 [Aspergillus cristatus]|uniref:Catalase core domain-containing protein n=1 Tax=Aspergillus cristatus TaxID=573508 RepID=A0A1E3B3A0_ASPCR|nr:hypothetical protein SI65_09340 [Aspergillus cristatus]
MASEPKTVAERPKAVHRHEAHPTTSCGKAGRLPDPPVSKGYFTLPNGCPVEHPLLAERADKQVGSTRYGSQLIQDLNTVEQIAHISRERIPERLVHAKGVGVFGEFVVTNKDIAKYTDASFLQPDSEGKSKTTRLLARFSTIAGELGYPDTVRDAKGAAFKFYTEEGNLDWVFLNPEVFNLRDPAKFASLVHAKKRDPATNLLDANMLWDFFSSHPETFNALMRNYTDEGTPKSYSRLVISSVNTYTFTKRKSETEWDHHLVRIKLVPETPIDPDKDWFTYDEATTMAGKDPDYLTRRLYDEIQRGQFPTWKVSAQILDPAKTSVDVLDDTKVVPASDCPWIEFGQLKLNELPQNYFTQVKQAAFTPANIVPGWDISPDPILQIRLLSYGDSQRYRLGANHDQLPPNRACSYVYDPTRRNGAHSLTHYANAPNYIGSRERDLKKPDHYNISFLNWQGNISRYLSKVEDVDYRQCREHWDTLSGLQQSRFISNVASSVAPASLPVWIATIAVFTKIWQATGHETPPGPSPEELTKALEDEINARLENNKSKGGRLGVVPGGEDSDGLNYIPPTFPDPSTRPVPDIYERV